MPADQLRSRANTANSSTTASPDKEAWNARLSDRRRQRREQRLRPTRGGAAPISGALDSTGKSKSDSSSNSNSKSNKVKGSSGVINTNTNTNTNTPKRNNRWNRRTRSNGNSGTGTGCSSCNRRINQAAYGIILCCLVAIWLIGFIFLAQRAAPNPNPTKQGPLQYLRQVGGGVAHQLQQHKFPMRHAASKHSMIQLHGDPNQMIDMRDLNAELIFDDPNGGAWTQGWDVEPVPIGKDERPLRIFVVPHSHCDPGWIKTFDEYFQSQTKQILTTVVESLDQHPGRKFIWAEISYFEWWWREQSVAMQDVVRRLLSDGQFEFVTGGWVQPDEANTQLYAMEIQLQEGHDFIRATFGDEHIPKYGWSIDPFGYSPTMAYLLKKYDFQAMLIQRVHYRIKKELAQRKHLEFMWRQTWDTTGDYDIFTHVMPFYSYDVPHTCGPDPKVCCQFDFARAPGTGQFANSCPWGQQPQKIHDRNVQNRAMMLLEQYRKKANLYQSNVVIAPLGDDFRYQTRKEADAQFENYQRIFDYINQNVDGVEISFGTLSEYFQAVMGTFTPPLLKGSFFTYADRSDDYWSGYFTSRIFDKALDRQLERVLYAASSLGATKLELQPARRALSLFQHHDGVTGTAKARVVEDYAKQIHTAIRQCQEWMVKHFQHTNKDGAVSHLASCWQSDAPRGMSQNLCGESGKIVVYNPLETEQACGSVTVPAGSTRTASLPCEQPGALPNTNANIQFDPHTGLMTHPVREEWMVWKVRAGGAYLFVPGQLGNYQDRMEQEQGGYVVHTEHWKRTVVEKAVTNVDGSTAMVIDFIYETFLQNDNEEWFVRFTGDTIFNQGVFHTDLNGYNFDTHHFRSDMPIQSQVFPMPTLASIEDEHQRLTILSEHAQGAASLEEGSIDVWLDRRLSQDDNRGLGQGVMDNVPTRTRLRVVIEKDGYQHDNPEFEITPLCKLMWKELNHPLEMFGRLQGSQLLPIETFQEETSNQVSTRKKQQQEHHEHGSDSNRYMIPPVYMVYQRVDYLKEAIESLRNSDFPRDRVPIIISHDGHIDATTNYVNSIKSDFLVIQLFHPYACSDHPNSFPGDDPKLNENYPGDAYGNSREAKITCCKHHFTWLMNTVFTMDDDMVQNADGFLFLEEDYTVASTVYETIQNGLEYLDSTGSTDHFGLTLDPTEGYSFVLEGPERGWVEKRFVTGPMVFRREMYQKIKDNADAYCTFDEYNWDWSIVHLMGLKIIPHLVLVPHILQVAHIGLNGGLHANSITEEKQEKMKVRKHLKPFHDRPSDFEIKEFQSSLKPHNEGFGGWGHPADQEHCLSLFGRVSKSTWKDMLHL